MGKYYVAKFPDQKDRIAAEFSIGRAKLFYEITKTIERFIECPSGVAEDIGFDEHQVNVKRFVEFFDQFWQTAWLADIEASFVSGWASYAVGIVENITLTPLKCVDRKNKELVVRRYVLSDSNLEKDLQRKKDEGIFIIKQPIKP